MDTQNNKRFERKFMGNVVLLSVLFSVIAGAFSGAITYKYLERNDIMSGNISTQNLSISEEDSVVTQIVEKYDPAVVSIIVSRDLPKIQDFFSTPFGDLFGFPFGANSGDQNDTRETEKQEVGGGTGFVVDAKKGLILTNKHVVSGQGEEYTALFNDESRIKVKVLAVHPTEDLALLEMVDKKDNLTEIQFADSDKLKVGQTVIAIGNSLGEFKNTVSKGVVSGLRRNIVASDGTGMNSEQLSDIIQTDAAINVGNSGGPLIDINGKVIGVNVAVASGAQNVGFAVQSNLAVDFISDVKEFGEVKLPYVGIRYRMIDETFAKENEIKLNYGALVVPDGSKVAIVPGSPADKAEIKENDIILEVNGVKLKDGKTLIGEVQKYRIGEEVEFKVSSKGDESVKKIKLEERPELD